MNSTSRIKISGLTIWILFCVACNAAGWTLSSLGCLNRVGYALFFGILILLTYPWWRKTQLDFRSVIRLRRFRKIIPFGFLLIASLAILGGILHAPANYDGLAYRTPRVLHWLAEESWHWIPTDFQRLNTRGAGFEWVTAPLIAFTGTDRFIFIINAISFAFLPSLFFSILTQLGVKKRVAWHWMWILPTGYCYILQAGSIANDLFGAVVVMAAIHYGLRAQKKKCVQSAWLALLAGALMTAAKGFNLLALLPLGLILLPVTGLLLKRIVPTLGIGLLGLFISLIPTSILNHYHCGDWRGLSAEPVSMSTGAPILHLSTNAVLLTLHNLNPPVNPGAGVWNRMMEKSIPKDLGRELEYHFETSGAKFLLGEMQIEEVAGIGFGVSIILLSVVLGPQKRRRIVYSKAFFFSPKFYVPISTLFVVGYFLSQSGLGCPARYLAPFYVVFCAVILSLPRADTLIGKKWWKSLVVGMFFLAVILLTLSAPRPLWPAKTILKYAHADESNSPLMKRLWTVYSVYGARSDGFAPIRNQLPKDLETLGFVSFDDPETSLWRPFETLRIRHISLEEEGRSVREQKIEYALVSEVHLSNRKLPLKDWLGRFDAELIDTYQLTLRASLGPTSWYLVRFSPFAEAQTP